MKPMTELELEEIEKNRYYCPFCRQDSARIRYMICAGTPNHPKGFKVRYMMDCKGCYNHTKSYRTKEKAIRKWSHKKCKRMLVYTMDKDYAQELDKPCNETKLIVVPRYTVIDGKAVTVMNCWECPYYDSGDGGWGNQCRYPFGNVNLPNQYC